MVAKNRSRPYMHMGNVLCQRVLRRAPDIQGLRQLGALCGLSALNSAGMGPIYDGGMHLATSPEDLVPALALALLAGLRGAGCGVRGGVARRVEARRGARRGQLDRRQRLTAARLGRTPGVKRLAGGVEH